MPSSVLEVQHAVAFSAWRIVSECFPKKHVSFFANRPDVLHMLSICVHLYFKNVSTSCCGHYHAHGALL